MKRLLKTWKKILQITKKAYKKKLVVKVPLNIYETINNAAKESVVERCGILVGYKSNHEYILTHIIEDKNTNDGTSLGVTRTTKGIWNELNFIARDHYPSDYLGEWHTHIAGTPAPSFIDIKTLYTLLNSKYYSFLDEIILAIETPDKGVAFWLFTRDKSHIKMKIHVSK